MLLRNGLWWCILIVGVVGLVLIPVLDRAEGAEGAEPACHLLLTGSECAAYRATLQRSRSAKERANISGGYARLVREREALCPCAPASLQGGTAQPLQSTHQSSRSAAG
jgi:hypothetical protein